MPRIQSNRDGGRITFDAEDFYGGLHPKFPDGASSYQRLDSLGTLGHAQAMNPYRFIGCASTGYDPSDVTNVAVVAGVIREAVISGDNAYMIASDDDIHEFDLTTSGALTSGAWYTIPAAGSHTGHSTFTGDDIINYYCNVSSTRQLCGFFTYQDGTDWDIGRITSFGSTTIDPDFMASGAVGGTVLSGGTTPTLASGKSVPHPMIVGADDILYIGDQNYVHEIDGSVGANGTFTSAVLVIPAGFRITSFARTPEYLVIFAYDPSSSATNDARQYGEAKAFFWDYLRQDPTFIFDLDDNFVRAGFEYQGTVGCFTQGRIPDLSSTSNESKLKLFDGTKFETIKTFDSDIPLNGGVDISGDIIKWNSEGHIFAWGAPYEGLGKPLNRLEKATGSSSGFCRTLNNTTTGLLVSSGTTTSGGLQRIRNNYSADGEFSTTMAQPTFPQGSKGKIKSVRVAFGQTNGDGRNIGLQLVMSDGTSSTIIPVTGGNQITTVTASTLVQEFFVDSSGGELPTFDDIKAYVFWNDGNAATAAPIVKRIDLEYEYIDIKENI